MNQELNEIVNAKLADLDKPPRLYRHKPIAIFFPKSPIIYILMGQKDLPAVNIIQSVKKVINLRRIG